MTLALRKFQEGKCELCSVIMVIGKKGGDGECVDHCHQTGVVRGLLCTSCNHALGIYEKRQRPRGVRIGTYDAYLTVYPALSVDVAGLKEI